MTNKHIIDSLFKNETLVLLACNGSIHYLSDKLPLASAGVMASSNTSYQSRFVSGCLCGRHCLCVHVCESHVDFNLGFRLQVPLYLIGLDLAQLGSLS